MFRGFYCKQGCAKGVEKDDGGQDLWMKEQRRFDNIELIETNQDQARYAG
jgi:hypothetical protein